MIPRSEVELVPVGFGACLLAQARERGGCFGEALAVVVNVGAEGEGCVSVSEARCDVGSRLPRRA